MTHTILWLHEKALGAHNQIHSSINEAITLVHVWDDHYYQQKGYTLKRLVFIYETLCQLPVDIIHGDTLSTFQTLNPTMLLIPRSVDSTITKTSELLFEKIPSQFIDPTPFCNLPKKKTYKRFFPYWYVAKKTCFNTNGAAQ